MLNLKFILIKLSALLFLFILGCNGTENKQETDENQSNVNTKAQSDSLLLEKELTKTDIEALLKEITDLEVKLVDSKTLKTNRFNAKKLYDKATYFIEKAPEHAMHKSVMIKAKMAARGLNDNYNAANLLNKIIEKYPEDKEVPNYLFELAYLYENINEIDKAKATYQRIINEYPDHEMAAQSRLAIDLVGVDPAEIIKEFEKKNK